MHGDGSLDLCVATAVLLGLGEMLGSAYSPRRPWTSLLSVVSKAPHPHPSPQINLYIDMSFMQILLLTE